jgi:cytochrome b involved in lipid metabolism
MRKGLLLALMALVLSVVVAPGSTAAVKAGAACKKAGQTSTAAGKKFTCVQKSGKLIWNKGVAVKKSAKPSTTATTKPTTKPTTSTSAAPSAAATPAAKPTTATTVAAGYTMAQVKANNSRAKCWTVISENVYDLTAWIGDHPGGAGAIVSLCGTDGTQGFLAMHRNQSKPESRLAGYLLGPLAK